MYKYGEIKCESILKSGKKAGLRCTNGAYFSTENGYLCGMHSKNMERKELEKMSGEEKQDSKNKELNKMWESATNVAEINLKNGKAGSVKLLRLGGRFSKVTPEDGVLDVYPNYMSTYQGIGMVCSELSPMSIGPIKHGQKDLPEAKNLENFYQYSKFYSKLENKEKFKELQIAGFNDVTPHRRKYNKTDIPDYFVWCDNTGEHHLTYLEARQFYCNYYQRGIENNIQFLYLKDLMSKGYNLRICGPDAYDLKSTSLESYTDTTVPRGHEFCIYEMLTNSKGDYPWIIMKTFDF